MDTNVCVTREGVASDTSTIVWKTAAANGD